MTHFSVILTVALCFTYWVSSAVMSLDEYAMQYLALRAITKHNILANVHRAKGYEQMQRFASSLEISELWKAVSSAALLNTVADGDAGITFLKSLHFYSSETQMVSKCSPKLPPAMEICVGSWLSTVSFSDFKIRYNMRYFNVVKLYVAIDVGL